MLQTWFPVKGGKGTLRGRWNLDCNASKMTLGLTMKWKLFIFKQWLDSDSSRNLPLLLAIFFKKVFILCGSLGKVIGCSAVKPGQSKMLRSEASSKILFYFYLYEIFPDLPLGTMSASYQLPQLWDNPGKVISREPGIKQAWFLLSLPLGSMYHILLEGIILSSADAYTLQVLLSMY